MATTNPDATTISFSVNGEAVQVAALPHLTLLLALRQDLALRGTRLGCAQGNCGACTVWLDGRAIQSCTTPLETVAGRSVTTIEGLNEGDRPGAVQQAFLDEQAAQCGYCTNGIIMTVTSLLQQSPTPSRKEILAHLDERHLCRCGAQLRILRALDRVLAQTTGPRP